MEQGIEAAFWPFFSLGGLDRAGGPGARAERRGSVSNPSLLRHAGVLVLPSGAPSGSGSSRPPLGGPAPPREPRGDFDPPPTLEGPPPPRGLTSVLARARAPFLGQSVSASLSHLGPSLLFLAAATSLQTRPLPPLVFTAPPFLRPGLTGALGPPEPREGAPELFPLRLLFPVSSASLPCPTLGGQDSIQDSVPPCSPPPFPGFPSAPSPQRVLLFLSLSLLLPHPIPSPPQCSSRRGGHGGGVLSSSCPGLQRRRQ